MHLASRLCVRAVVLAEQLVGILNWAGWCYACRDLQQRKQASLAARRLLLRANHGLVAKVVMQFEASQRNRGGSCLQFADSLEAGMQGLLKAIMKFEPEVRHSCCCCCCCCLHLRLLLLLQLLLLCVCWGCERRQVRGCLTPTYASHYATAPSPELSFLTGLLAAEPQQHSVVHGLCEASAKASVSFSSALCLWSPASRRL